MVMTGDIADRETVRQLLLPGAAVVFHLAAVVSGQAEADTDLGYRVNLDGTRAVLDACRALGTCPRLVFASSLAVYGGALPPAVGDDTPLTPQSSYGTQKAIGELLVNDYTRKGFVDGRALRLPTVVVRPGLPNRAASTFASSIIREPLAGKEAICPVSPDLVMALASPRRVVAALHHAHELPGEAFGANRSLAIARLFGRGRRHGRGGAPRRRRGSTRANPLAARSAKSRRSSPAGRRRLPHPAPPPSALPPTPTSTKPSGPLSKTTSKSRKRSADGVRGWSSRASSVGIKPSLIPFYPPRSVPMRQRTSTLVETRATIAEQLPQWHRTLEPLEWSAGLRFWGGDRLILTLIKQVEQGGVGMLGPCRQCGGGATTDPAQPWGGVAIQPRRGFCCKCAVF